MQGLVTGPGCSVDGTKAANPLGRVVDQFLGVGGSGANGRMVGPHGPVMGGPAGLRASMAQQYHAQQMRAHGQQHHHGGIGGSGIGGLTDPMNDIWMAQQRNGDASGGAVGAAAMNASFQAAQAQHANAVWAAAQQQSAGPVATASMQHPRAPQMMGTGPAMGGPVMGMNPAMMMGGMGGMGMNPAVMMGGMGGMGMNPMMMQPGMAPGPHYQGAPHMSPSQSFSVPVAPPQQQQRQQQQQGPIIEEVVENSAKAAVEEPAQQADADMSETRAMTREMVRVLSQNPKFQNSEFLGFMDKISKGEVEFAGNKVRAGDAKSMEEAAREASAEAAASAATASTSTANPEMSTAATLEERLAEAWKDSMAGKDVDLDAIWEEALAEGQGSFDNFGPMFGGQLNEEIMAQQMMGVSDLTAKPQYQLPQENKYRGQQELFEKGMHLFNDGEIKEAIEAFQAFVEGETDDPSEGWRMLGLSHQEHDEDRKAIICLERAVEEDPYNLDALLALGVSYVNELNSESALRTLKLWVEHNPSFQGMTVELDAYSDGSLMDEVMQLMISAQNAAAANGGDDTDVQVVLGVLYNVSRDYDSAVNAFQSAVRTRPGDYSLWNKLGATLANGSRSEQAIPAYHKALELKPKYARGRLNLGISHANLQNYGNAARAYLDALRLNPEATHIWSYLRIAFTCMERFDLVQMVSLFRMCSIFTGVLNALLLFLTRC